MTDWDKKIISDMEQTVTKLEALISGLGDAVVVRPLLGDSRPEPVYHWKTVIAQNKKWIDEIMENPSE